MTALSGFLESKPGAASHLDKLVYVPESSRTAKNRKGISGMSRKQKSDETFVRPITVCPPPVGDRQKSIDHDVLLIQLKAAPAPAGQILVRWRE